MTFYPLAEYAWHYVLGTLEFGMGRTGANSVCFTKNWLNIGDFPNGTSASKFKFARGRKRLKMPKCMGGAGKFFLNRLKKAKIH